MSLFVHKLGFWPKCQAAIQSKIFSKSRALFSTLLHFYMLRESWKAEEGGKKYVACGDSRNAIKTLSKTVKSLKAWDIFGRYVQVGRSVLYGALPRLQQWPSKGCLFPSHMTIYPVNKLRKRGLFYQLVIMADKSTTILLHVFTFCQDHLNGCLATIKWIDQEVPYSLFDLLIFFEKAWQFAAPST